MTDHSRRNFLKTSAAAGFTLICSLTPKEAFGAEALSGASARLVPFPLASVRLAPGCYAFWGSKLKSRAASVAELQLEVEP